MQVGGTIHQEVLRGTDCVSLALAKRLRYSGHMDATRIAPPSPMLTRITEILGLSHTDLGGLFGVSRQAVSQWADEEIPASRLAKVLVVAQIADLLALHLISDRIPAVARTPAEAYGGKTMLQMISADQQHELLASVRASFDWATTA